MGDVIRRYKSNVQSMNETTTTDSLLLFLLRDNLSGRFNPEPMTWEQANAAKTDFNTICRKDEVDAGWYR